MKSFFEILWEKERNSLYEYNHYSIIYSPLFKFYIFLTFF